MKQGLATHEKALQQAELGIQTFLFDTLKAFSQKYPTAQKD